MTAPPTSNPQVNPALGVCEYCGTPNDDAGPGIGAYCPAASCPGDAIYAARAREMVEADRIRNAIETLEGCGYRVDKSSGETSPARQWGPYKALVQQSDGRLVGQDGCPHLIGIDRTGPYFEEAARRYGRDIVDVMVVASTPTTGAAESSHCKVHAKPNAQCPECMS